MKYRVWYFLRCVLGMYFRTTLAWQMIGSKPASHEVFAYLHGRLSYYVQVFDVGRYRHESIS